MTPNSTPSRSLRDLPAPPGLPLVGNLLQLERDRLHLTLEEWRRTYGDYYRFRNVSREVLVISDPEAIATMLRDRPDGFLRTSRLASIAREMGFDGVFTANGEEWRRQRPMVMAGLDPQHIKTYFPALVRVTQRFAGRWRLAGEDTTANTLAWMIYLLSRNPQALARARDEVRAVLGSQSFPSQYEQLAKLPFVEACANETMRLRPVAPLLILEAGRAAVVAGIEIPARQVIMCLMRPGATDERHFPDPQKFD